MNDNLIEAIKDHAKPVHETNDLNPKEIQFSLNLDFSVYQSVFSTVSILDLK